jgi:hypothetical protein
LPRPRIHLGGRALVTAAFLLLVLASPAAADPCALIDPECVTETVDDTVDKVTETVGSAEETAKDTLDDGSEVVGDTATGLVGTVKDTVDGLLGKKRDPDPGPKPGGGVGRDRPGARDHRGEGRRTAQGQVGLRSEPRDPSLDTTFRRGQSVLDWPTLNPPDGGVLRRAAGAATRLAFPILLASMVVAFLAIQNYLDRRDPRLASAPLGPDLLTFE